VIDELTLAEAGEIFAYWEENPPPHLLLQWLARQFGWAPRPAPSEAPGIAAIAAAPPPGLAIVPGGDIGMPPPLDPATLRARNQARADAFTRHEP